VIGGIEMAIEYYGLVYFGFRFKPYESCDHYNEVIRILSFDDELVIFELTDGDLVCALKRLTLLTDGNRSINEWKERMVPKTKEISSLYHFAENIKSKDGTPIRKVDDDWCLSIIRKTETEGIVTTRNNVDQVIEGVKPKNKRERSLPIKDVINSKPNFLKLRDLIKKLGEKRAIRFLLLQELADENGIIKYCQTDLIEGLLLSDRLSVRKLMEELCVQGLLSVHSEYDSKEKIPRIYKVNEWYFKRMIEKMNGKIQVSSRGIKREFKD